MLRHLSFICTFALGATLLASCSSKAPAPDLTEITVYNTGTLPMHPPQVCYYQNTDPKQCMDVEGPTEGIAPGSSYNFFIRANEKIRLVFPFDETQRFKGVMYRPNCHILVDFFAYQEKRYHAEAEIRAAYNDPEKGFNCAINMLEQALGASQKIEMNEQAFTKIRYLVPRKGEVREGYVSNYDWQ